MKSISRRQFITGGATLAMAFLMGTRLRLYGVGERSPYVIEGTRNIMGTSVTVSIIHHDVDAAKEAMALAFNEVFKINDLMSVYRVNSEVHLLNENGFYEGASADTIRVIERANHYSRLSGGAFAITVLPIMANLRFTRSMLELTNYENIRIENGNIGFKKAGMGITLGGIAKGYAVDRAVEVLRQNGIERALISAGGDI
ncbi:MAG: FAD:protein FMN transferase, partial [Methanocellales archaeon]|nr:FAD:protein FMN transferase [Methanocellales archaeon]